MKKFSFIVAAIAALAVAAPAVGQELVVDDPTNAVFTDNDGNQGYVSAGTDYGIRACNENPETPAGDELTGYIWVNPYGESTTPTYGNANVGAGDYDGDDVEDPAGPNPNDCPSNGGNTLPTP